MSDGPYREQSLVPVSGLGPKPIVLAEEIAPPSRRLVATDYDDGSLSVVQRKRYALLAMPVVAAAFVSARWHGAGPLVAILALVVLKTTWEKFFLPKYATELLLSPRTVSWQDERKGGATVLLEDVSSFEPGTGGELRIVLKSGDVATTFRRAVTPYMQACLSGDELAWLAGRLNRALARVKR